jgi:hypothetical protein
MKVTLQQHGIVAILDALGVASYSDDEVQLFMDSRELLISSLQEKAEVMCDKLDVEMISTFTFNDTILIILRSASHTVQPNELQAFFTMMRKFLADSLAHKILFRGSLSIGTFYVNDERNTVMGEAVTDAAAWYEKTEWIGLIATPRASMLIQNMLEREPTNWNHLMVDYDVPKKDFSTVRLKAVNWPKVFFHAPISPCRGTEKPREKLLQLLSQHQIPFGTESKFNNTVAFFDYVVETQKLNKKRS